MKSHPKPVLHSVDALSHAQGLEAILGAAPQGRTTPPPTEDAVALAEWLGGDRQRSFVYRQSLAEHRDFAKTMLDAAVEDIVDVVHRERNRSKRRAKLAQAESVISRLRTNAADNWDPTAINDVIWCDALVSRLEPLRE